MSTMEARTADAPMVQETKPANPHDYAARMRDRQHDTRDPDPWLAMFLDNSLPIAEQTKAALLLDQQSFSRGFILPFLRPMARIMMAVVGIIRLIMPTAFHSSKVLHRLIYWGLKYFVSPEANYLILRHFNCGTEILSFIAANAPVKVPTNPLRPNRLEDVLEDLFLVHDLNLYNFVINLNKRLREEGKQLVPPEKLDFSMITDGEFPMEAFPRRWTNILDLSSAIEIYSPLFQLCLTNNDFWRSSNSLQLDETVGIYAARLFGDASHLGLVNNRHPLVPMTIFRAAPRLVLHGLATETLHGLLLQAKRRMATASGQAGLQGVWGLKDKAEG